MSAARGDNSAKWRATIKASAAWKYQAVDWMTSTTTSSTCVAVLSAEARSLDATMA